MLSLVLSTVYEQVSARQVLLAPVPCDSLHGNCMVTQVTQTATIVLYHPPTIVAVAVAIL